ncbi:MAG: hypothetical protein V4466_02925 [Pseudomonadota bacterium]
MHRNEGGSVDLYFGSAEPAGNAVNWIPNALGRQWISLFRSGQAAVPEDLAARGL